MENEIIINGVAYVNKESLLNNVNVNGMDFVLVRTYSAGVHFGYLAERNGKEVKLLNARRIWKWEGAFTLSQIAMTGTSKPENCMLSIEVNEIILTEAIEIIKITQKSKDILDKIEGIEK